MNEIYGYALKLLQRRDYTVSELRERLQAKFGAVPDETIESLIQRNFLNDRRYAENYVAKRRHRGMALLREELQARGIAGNVADEILTQVDWPSLHDALKAKMNDWKLGPPLQPREAGRLFRALTRLGYDEDAIREEIENVNVSERKPDKAQPSTNEQ